MILLCKTRSHEQRPENEKNSNYEIEYFPSAVFFWRKIKIHLLFFELFGNLINGFPCVVVLISEKAAVWRKASKNRLSEIDILSNFFKESGAVTY